MRLYYCAITKHVTKKVQDELRNMFFLIPCESILKGYQTSWGTDMATVGDGGE